MAHPGIGFLFLIGAGIVAAVGLIFAANHNHQYSYNTNGNPSPPPPSDSWNDDSDARKKCRRRRKSETEKSCSICLSNDNICDFKLKCGHMFHLDCLVKWVKLQKTCPNCRSSLDDTFLN